MQARGLYLHIPFCDARCSYCDFVTFVDRENQIEAYVEALETEMRQYTGTPLQTIFIGGGTPTVLSPAQISNLLSFVRNNFDLTLLAEATVEANPESATPERLKAFQDGGINRVSFGLQTMDDDLLRDIGRLHDKSRFLEAFATARSLGFANINVDTIFGLPGQTLASWRRTLQEIVRLAPEHVSAYALKVEKNTPMGVDGVEPDADLQADMYLWASEFLEEEGYGHYEISNFARPGQECRHNKLYWENADTIGAGVSAVSYLDGRRVKNGVQLGGYIRAWQKNQPFVAETDVLDEKDRARESVMLNLRLSSGVDADTIEALGVPMTRTFLENGLARREDGKYRLLPRGWLVSNQLFQYLV